MNKLLIFMMLITFLFGSEVVPINKTTFKVIHDDDSYEVVDLTGREFIVITLRERGSDGRFYAVDRSGIVWWSGPLTSGADDYKTPPGIYPVLYKKRFHMSKQYPDESGINNMDYSIFFTKNGHAIHKGSINWMSHGCIHIDPKDIPTLYRWAKPGLTKVVVIRGRYMKFARDDLKRFNLK
jgi:lipoprotein-anchoring transpeptidase ErfK/SrfK